MSIQPPVLEPIRHSIVVAAPPARAFEIFTGQIDSWWPLAVHSIGQNEVTGCLVEGRTGGGISETHGDGSIHTWGTVTDWHPPERVVFSWHPGREADTAQEIELRFTEVSDGTLVELEHRGWESLGDRAAETREAYQSGWPAVLSRYQAACSSG
jgi:uncharacterized protein YndB with AHSA1/START domain